MSMSICASAGGKGMLQVPVASCVNRQPIARSPSASLNSGEKHVAMFERSDVALRQGKPAESG